MKNGARKEMKRESKYFFKNLKYISRIKIGQPHMNMKYKNL